MIIEAANRRRWMVLGAVLPLLLCACVAPTQGMDPDSPLAEQSTALSREAGAYPTFAAIPQVPDDLRPGEIWARDVASVTATRAQIVAQTAPSTFSLNNTEAFAAATRARVGPSGGVPDEAATRASADAFARAVRARATPPPTRR
jgi:hypothetical protein